MKCALYASLFVLLTVILVECRAQVNIADIDSSGGGSTNIHGVAATNKGSQVVNEFNGAGNRKALLSRQYPQSGNVPNQNFYPNGNFYPNENFYSNGNGRPYWPNGWNGNYGPRGNRPYGNFGHPDYYTPSENYRF